MTEHQEAVHTTDLRYAVMDVTRSAISDPSVLSPEGSVVEVAEVEVVEEGLTTE
ncbi:hypothetical protein [Streptomyces sp. NPDC002537]